MGVNKSSLGNFVALISLGLERGSSEGESKVVRHAQDAAFFPDIHAAELQKAGLSVMLGVAKDGLGCLGPPITGLDFDHGRTPFQPMTKSISRPLRKGSPCSSRVP